MKLKVSSLMHPRTLLFIKMIFAQKRAVERNIEIIGEAMNRILNKDSAIELSNTRKIVDTRNRIIHGYDTLSDEIIWSIVVTYIPVLKIEIEKLLDE